MFHPLTITSLLNGDMSLGLPGHPVIMSPHARLSIVHQVIINGFRLTIR
jgi:hypothetical protein